MTILIQNGKIFTVKPCFNEFQSEIQIGTIFKKEVIPANNYTTSSNPVWKALKRLAKIKNYKFKN